MNQKDIKRTKEVIKIMKEKKIPKCPNCEEKLIKIEYGLAGKPENDEAILGGCVMFDDSPVYHCINCNKDFLRI